MRKRKRKGLDSAKELTGKGRELSTVMVYLIFEYYTQVLPMLRLEERRDNIVTRMRAKKAL